MLIWSWLACTAADPLPCAFIDADQPPPRSEADLAEVLATAQAALYPELDGVQVTLQPTASETDYFVANLELATFEDPPLQRHYLVLYSTRLFDDPPPYAAVGAILGHELKHIVDYTGMDAEALAAFAIDYNGGDISAYEHATDEAALERGCATGLIAYREWLYAHVDAETAAQKRIDYYTPEEIRAWQDQHGY